MPPQESHLETDETSKGTKIGSLLCTENGTKEQDVASLASLSTADDENEDADKDNEEEVMGKAPSLYEIYFTKSGPPQMLMVIILMACGYGCVVSVVPTVMKDRYARLNHGWEGEDCSEFDSDNEPDACDKGGDDAQNAAALASLLNNSLSFVFCPLFGALSDASGRRTLMLVGLAISCLPTMTLVAFQEVDDMNPLWFYGAISITGVISWFAILVAGISDVIEPRWRTAAYGVTSVGWGIGFSISPSFAVTLSNQAASVASLSLLCSGFLYAYFFIPETLSKEIADKNAEERKRREDLSESTMKRTIYRPFRDMTILNRNSLFRTMAIVNCLSSMAFSAEFTLLVYYVDDELDFSDGEVAAVFAISGILGMIVCGALIKPLNELLGERLLLVYAYAIGAIHDVFYGCATTSTLIFVGATLFGFTNVSYPAIASIKANNVDEREQGIVQGALVAVSSLAAGVGPLSFRAIYYITEDTEYPGSMFLFGAFLFAVAAVISYFLPEKDTNARMIIEAIRNNDSDSEVVSQSEETEEQSAEKNNLTQPLLHARPEEAFITT